MPPPVPSGVVADTAWWWLQVPIEVEVSEEAMAAGAAKVSAAVTEAMKEGHAKSVAMQQQKLK